MGLPNKLRKMCATRGTRPFLKTHTHQQKTSCSHVQKNLQPFSNDKQTNKQTKKNNKAPKITCHKYLLGLGLVWILQK